MITLTKEWLLKTIAELEEERDAMPGAVNEDAAMKLAAMKLALASLEAEAVAVSDDMAYAFHHALSDSSLGADEVEEIKTGLRAAFANVTAPPAPVSVPATMNTDDDFDSAFEHGKAVGWNAYRAAMLQGAKNAESRCSNSPVIQDGWVACSDRLPDPDSAFRVCAYTPTPHEDFRFRSVPASLFKSVCRDATHWQYMLPPAAPQRE